MSKSRAKKLRKRARQAAAVDGPDAGDGHSAWYNEKGETSDRNFLTLKLEALGPFLFGQTSLCDKAVSLGKERELLPVESVMWPMFFERQQWELLQKIVTVICSTVYLCETNSTFCGYLMSPTKSTQDDNSLANLVQIQSKQLKIYSTAEILPIFQLFRIHAMEFTTRAFHSNPGSSFFTSLAEKDKLIAPVKDRGNTNYKLQRYRAAIADYTTALRLCPYSAILYSNRALCYLKNEDYWSSCLDSYRALVLKPSWEKPYYRCAESLYKLGDLATALTINSAGRSMCEQQGDLERQQSELQQLNRSSEGSTGPASAIATEIDASMESTSVELETNSRPSKKSKLEVKEKPVEDKNHSNSSGENISATQKVSSKRVQSSKDQGSSMAADTAHQKREEPFTKFELLQYPVLDSKISCHQLRQLCNHVKLKNCSPASYLAQGSAWESLEPTYYEPPRPKTDPSSIHRPMPAVFDEIWCPVIADVEDSDLIIPPTFTYLDNGAVKQTLPTLVTGPIRKDRLPGY